MMISFDMLSIGVLTFPTIYLFFLWFYRLRFSQDHIVKLFAERSVSGIQAIIVITAALFIIWETRADMIYSRSKLFKPFISFLLPYFFNDFMAMFLSYVSYVLYTNNQYPPILAFIKHNFIFLLHHIGIILIGFPIALNYLNLRGNLGDNVLGTLLLSDISNLFLSLRPCLIMFFKRNSTIYLCNELFFIVSFVTFRIISIPYLFLRFCLNYQISFSQMIYRIPKLLWLCQVISSFTRRMTSLPKR